MAFRKSFHLFIGILLLRIQKSPQTFLRALRVRMFGIPSHIKARQPLSYILWYHGSMDITAYWLNHKRRDAGEGKVYYLYPYTRCEADDTPTLFIGGKHYIRIAVSEEEWTRLRKLDDKEYNSERRAHNKRWTADIPRLRDEDGEEIDFWSDRAEDRETRYIEGDICEKTDRRALVRSFDKIDRRIYRLDRKDFTQQEIARRLHLDQATVSRRLEKIYMRLDFMRLFDGERSRQELAFEVAWEEFLRTGHMRGDADVRAFAFFLRARGELLALLYKWFFTPGELLRYAVRYLMVGGTETKGELLEQLSGYGQAFFARQKFADEVEEKLCLRLLREVERRAATIPEPSGNALHRYEEEIKELAHRRRLPCTFYFEEILMRKYEFKRICKTLSYAKRIASRMRNVAQKAVLHREIAILEAERVALQRLLFRLAERYAVRYEGEGKLGINS